MGVEPILLYYIQQPQYAQEQKSFATGVVLSIRSTFEF